MEIKIQDGKFFLNIEGQPEISLVAATDGTVRWDFVR